MPCVLSASSYHHQKDVPKHVCPAVTITPGADGAAIQSASHAWEALSWSRGFSPRPGNSPSEQTLLEKSEARLQAAE